METRIVRSKPGMPLSDAVASLTKAASANNEEIIDFQRVGNRFVAKLAPKAAEFPPADKEDKEESEADKDVEKADKEIGDAASDEARASDPDGDGDDDSSPEGDTDKDFAGAPGSSKSEGEKGEEKGELSQLLSLVHQIAEKLGIQPAAPHDKMISGDGPAVPPPPSPGGPDGPGIGSAGKDGNLPTKLGPGEVLPHQTPIGAPAFASTKQAAPDPVLNQIPGLPAPAPASPQGVSAPSGQTCPQCGGAMVNGKCSNCGYGNGFAASVADPAGVVGNKKHIAVRSNVAMSEVDAYREMIATFGPKGYKVARLDPRPNGHWLAYLEG